MRPVTLYAGLAVMLMRRYRNVLPIKYLYRRSGVGNEGFSFEPTMTGREDRNYLKSSVYPELIHAIDSRAARHSKRIGIGNIPASWKLQRKGGHRLGGDVYGGGKVYHRGQHTESTTPAAFQYEDYGYFKGSKKYTSGEWKGRTGMYRYGRGGITTPASDPQDLMKGAGSNIPSQKTLAVADRFTKFQAGNKAKLSNRQISPRGMKARWIRGGGPGGGQHLKSYKLPNKTRLSTGTYEGEVDKLPKSHIMHHWYKLWENNYNTYLRNQSQRVLISFLKYMGKADVSKKIKGERRKISTGAKVVRAKGRQARGKGRAARTYSTRVLIKRFTKTSGLAGVVSPQTVLDTISEGGLHIIGSNKSRSSIEDLFNEISSESTSDLNDFINNVSQLERQINKDVLKRNRVPKDNTVLGFFLGNFLGLIIVGRPGKGKNSPVKLTPTVLMTGRKEAQMIAQSLLRKEKKKRANTNQARIAKTSVAAKQNLQIIAAEVDSVYALIGKNLGTQLVIEGESGAGTPIDRDFANILKRRMTRALKGNKKETDAEMRKAFDPHPKGQPEESSNFMEWYLKWMREAHRLERRIVEMQRARWGNFMTDWVGPKTDKYREGDVDSYRKAKTWHSPGYVRPFVLTDVPKGGSMDQQKPF